MSNPDDQPEGPAGESWSHLQAAALELIAAGRSFLDAADAAVRFGDPGTVVRGLADLGRDVVANVRTDDTADHDRSEPVGDDGDDYFDIPVQD